MRRVLALLVVLGCSSSTSTPVRTAAAPEPSPPPACSGDECSAPIEAEPRFEQPTVDTRPPDTVATPAEEATCQTVGAIMASLELGNYADPEELAPKIATHSATCERLALDQAARTCVAQQSDRASVAYCAPGLVDDPSLAILPATDCDAVIAEATKRTATRSRLDHEKRWWEPRAAAFLASCKKDRWTIAYGNCLKTQFASYCTWSAVAPLRTVVQAMMAAEDTREREARALWEKAYAEPKKYPKVKLELVTARGCADIERATTERLKKLPPQSWELQWYEPRAKALRASCRRDRWPRDFGDCVKERGVHSCHPFTPAALSAKLQPIFSMQVVPKPPTPHRHR